MSAEIALKTITRYIQGQSEQLNDRLAIEEPLEIRLEYGPENLRIQKNISITMRTPGHDKDLTRGFLFTEGIVQNVDQIVSIDPVIRPFLQTPDPNVILAKAAYEAELELSKLERHFYTTSSCGVCGKSSIEAIRTVQDRHISEEKMLVDAAWITHLPDLLRKSQEVFDSTGGLHASALFEVGGSLTLLREDVGRHNALDKLIGAALKQGLALNQCVLLLSGRASFELIQKAAMAGIPLVAAVGAPSSLAVDLATEFGITLVGFLKSERFNVYSHPERIILKP
jgi:FdhD protein